MNAPLGLFEGYGIEIEYAIVDAHTLDVRPIADRLLAAAGAGAENEVAFGDLAWSNELALHLVELKTNGPASSLEGLGERFAAHVARVDALLAPMGARVMPTGMHPWMDPARELRLWPHANDLIYRTFDRIFDCRGHGWANLQSMHVNLPFANDAELGRLHAAIRLVLPLVPALAASSPFLEARASGSLDTRLEVYRTNSARVPSVTGRVVPEPAFTRADYERIVLEPIYADLAPYDPEGVLRDEWVNARGAIARFDRMAIEIRLVDTQECPRADLAVAWAVVGAVRVLVEERFAGFAEQAAQDTDALAALLREAMREGDATRVRDRAYLACLGWAGTAEPTMGEVWQHLRTAAGEVPEEHRAALDTIAREGCLARRIVAAAGTEPSHARLHAVYARLCECLARGEIFHAGDV